MGDIDERRNRIFIGVVDSSGLELVENSLLQVPVPRNAVVVDVVPRFQAEASLQGAVPPLVAGVQAVWLGSAYCTLGYNVSGGQGWHWVTASHCTSATWELTGHSMGQPEASNVVGDEVADPQRFTSATDANCPSGELCRYPDAALIKYSTSDWTHGVIAYPSEPGSLLSTNTVLISGEATPLAGDAVEKVGRTTGRSVGWIDGACADLRHPTNTWMICQGVAHLGNAIGGTLHCDRQLGSRAWCLY